MVRNTRDDAEWEPPPPPPPVCPTYNSKETCPSARCKWTKRPCTAAPSHISSHFCFFMDGYMYFEDLAF